MPRPTRIDYCGALHHVTLSAQRDEPVFACPRCRDAVFLALSEASTRFRTRTLAYAVMNTHLHLYLESPDARLPRTMQHLSGAITRLVNAHHGYRGHVFRGRYFNRVVEGDAYRDYLLAYIHLNPSRAGLDRHTLDPRWTSHRAYLRGTSPDWLHTEPLLTALDGPQGYRQAIELVRTRRRTPPVGFAEAVLVSPRCTGRLTLPEPEEPEAPSARALLVDVEQRLGRLQRGRRDRRTDPLRDAVMAWLLERGCTQSDIGRALRVSQPAVSRAITRHQRRVHRGEAPVLLDLDRRMRTAA